jgi:nucleoid-associated protein YgaU
VQRQWVVYSVTFNEALRDPVAGFRVQQKLQIILYEYNSPLATQVGNPTPAQAAQTALNAAEASQSYSLYTVVQGDNLPLIAANTLGYYTLWTEIATLNDIRDPNNVTPGQIIKIPQP